MILTNKITDLIEIIKNSVDKVQNKFSAINGIVYIKFERTADQCYNIGYISNNLEISDNIYKVIIKISDNNVETYLNENNIKIFNSSDIRGINFENKIIILEDFTWDSKEYLKQVLFRLCLQSELVLIVDSKSDNTALKQLVNDYDQISIIETNDNLIVNCNRYMVSNFDKQGE